MSGGHTGRPEDDSVAGRHQAPPAAPSRRPASTGPGAPAGRRISPLGGQLSRLSAPVSAQRGSGRRTAEPAGDVEATTPHVMAGGRRRPAADTTSRAGHRAGPTASPARTAAPGGPATPGRAAAAGSAAGRSPDPGRAGAGGPPSGPGRPGRSGGSAANPGRPGGPSTDPGRGTNPGGRASRPRTRDQDGAVPGQGTAAALVARARGAGGDTADRGTDRPAGQGRASDGRGAGAGGTRRRGRPAGDGPRRWLEPAAYASMAAGIAERAGAHRAARKAKLARMTRRQRAWHYGRVAGVGGLVLFVALPALVFTLGYLFLDIPTPDDAVNKQVATISFSDSSELARIVPEEGNRTKVSIDQVPRPVQLAVLAAEDRSFFSNPGFDPVGIARAAWKQLTGGTGGGSTITQQYVKKTLVGDERSLWRKYKEMVIAVKISQQNGKDEILADYLNAIYFGRGAYGIQSASHAYFGKDVSQLGASEGALLAGVIQSPSRWDPAVNPQRAGARWSFVMDGMVSQGWLSAEERDRARFPTTQPRPKTSGAIPSDYRGLILSAIKDELEQKGISEQEFNQEGLKITTTIDPEAQRRAVDSARKALIGQPPNLRGALVSVDPDTGGITAYYGGDNGVGLDYARVSKQPGSTFKPFVLLAALLQNEPIGLGTRFKGEALPGLRNSDGADCAVCDIKQAMTISNNVVFHELTLRVGPQQVADAARRAGVNSPLTNPNEGIALGNKEITPVDLASAYATFASGGVYHPPHLVTKVTTSDDRVIYEAVPTEERRFSAQVARNVTEAMLGVPVYDKLNLTGGRVSAAKTGTVQSHVEGENNDAWIAGYTPGLATAVWIGTDQNSPIRTSKGTPITGAAMPGSIWRAYMNEAVEDDPDEESFGSFKAIGTPPAAVGPADGHAAGPATPTASTVPSAPPLPSSAPDFPASAQPYPPGEYDRGSGGARRDCGLLGCRTVEDGDASDEREDPEEHEDERQPDAGAAPRDTSDSTPATRQPVRG